MTIKDCIQYEDKNITENEVVKLLNSTEIMKNVSNEIYNDVLWLLSHKELSYLYYYKQKDTKSQLLIKIFKSFDISIKQNITYVKLKDKKTYIKVTLEII